ncbi:MAG: histidine kinase [Verrucomicrobiota bacterium]
MLSSVVSALPSPAGDEARLQRAKDRLYVICQSVGWGALTLVQMAVLNAVAKVGSGPWELALLSSCTGLLLTHLGRTLIIQRRGWKKLDWKGLLPRVLALSCGLSVMWTAVCFDITYWVMEHPNRVGTSSPLVLIVSIVNGVVLMLMWLSFYFFYNAYDRTHRLELDRARLMASAKESELRALKSQINPHFIFNSLNSLRALIDENPARARQAVTQLANLLRYSLQSAQAETVAFEDELRVVNDYLALEQVRHEERLRVRLDIDPETLGLAVPPLLLQTLVENAVKYGISTRPEGGEISITARCENGQLEIRVTNPGELPTASVQAAAANRSGALAGGGSTGLGLKNAAERLRVFFGERARLELRSASESRVIAEVSIPMQTARA